jgi:hypothetical protein
VSPREKEPLTEPPPTVITYKYSSHSSHSTSSKFPMQPEEQQPLLPRPFPTPSPTPTPSTNSQPPKRLDDLMASFSDTEVSDNLVIFLYHCCMAESRSHFVGREVEMQYIINANMLYSSMFLYKQESNNVS